MTVLDEIQNGKVGNFSGSEKPLAIGQVDKTRINTSPKLANGILGEISHWPTWPMERPRAIIISHVFGQLSSSVYAGFITKNRTWPMANGFSLLEKFPTFPFFLLTCFAKINMVICAAGMLPIIAFGGGR